MIRLSNIDDTIKEQHVEWFKSYVEKNLEEKIKELETVENPSNSNFIKFLKELKSIENLAIIENTDMLNLIDKFHQANLSEEDLKILKEIFNYKYFSELEPPKWSRHQLLTSLGVRVCPYCQRNYITSYTLEENKEDKVEKTTADLDHFYSKKDYPFLALSLYNFIPSCSICNSRMKLKKTTYDKDNKKNSIVYPYTDNFKGVFKTNNQLLEVLLGSRNTFEVSIADQGDSKTHATINTFKLDKVYKEAHNEYLLHMMKSIKNKPESYLKSIAEFFIKEDSQDKEELEKVILANLKAIVLEPYRFKIENGEPLAKLTQDILKEFDIEI